MLHLWHHILQTGPQYGVNTLVFAVLYLIHHPLFWGTFALVVNRLRLRRPYKLLAALAAFFWFMPYLYIVIFGHGLPWWVYALLLLVVTFGALQAAAEIRKRLNPPAG